MELEQFRYFPHTNIKYQLSNFPQPFICKYSAFALLYVWLWPTYRVTILNLAFYEQYDSTSKTKT